MRLCVENKDSITNNLATINYNCIVKDTRVIFQAEGNKLVIPSTKYPIANKDNIMIFTENNTEELSHEIIEEVYNSIEFRMGRCYSNIENFIEELNKNGISDVKPYIGWLFSYNGGYPIHHCFAVYKDKYVIDPAMLISNEMYKREILKHPKEKAINRDFQRSILIECHNKIKNMKNSKKSTFGKVFPDSLYVGAEQNPNDGLSDFRILQSIYPNHEAYAREGMNMRGASKIQEMMGAK